jgi:surface antigen
MQPKEFDMNNPIIRKLTTVAAAAVVLVGVAACEGQGQKQTAGTLLGGVGGAVAGAQIGSGKGKLVATAAGTLLGAWLGSEVGKSLDNADRIAMERASSQALETNRVGQATTWRNPDTGASGSVTPIRTVEASPGQYCREYQQSVTVGGKTEEAFGKACRQPDGSWKIVN